MATVQAPQQEIKPIAMFKADLDKMAKDIQILLPKSITFDAFKRVTITALQENPELLAAERNTLFSACLNCAKDGLLPDGKEAAFVIFNTNIAPKGEEKKYVKRVAYMPMVGGLKKRIWACGEYTYFSAHPVFEGDSFDYCLGDNEYINHKPAMDNRGEVIAAYAIVKNKHGEYIRCVLTREDIEKIRKSSKAKDDLYWAGWYDQMAVKSAVRKLAKDLDLSVDFEDNNELHEVKAGASILIGSPEEKPMLPKPQGQIEGEVAPIKQEEIKPEEPEQPKQQAKPEKKRPF